MKVTVFGATGAIGRLVVDDLLQAGHDVVAYVRNPDKVPPHWPTDGVDIVVGSITDPAAVDDAVGRGQVVISALGPDLSRKTTGVPRVEGTRLIVTSMQRHEIQRFIGMATPSVLDPRDRRTLQPRVSTFMARSFLPRAYQEIVAMSKIIMSSDRIWTIIRFLAPVTGHRADQRRSARTIHADRPIVFHHSLVWLLHTAQVTALRSRHRLPQIDIEDHDEFPTILAQVNDDNLTLPSPPPGWIDDDRDAIVGEGSDNRLFGFKGGSGCFGSDVIRLRRAVSEAGNDQSL
jgi:putative NADH-flavin reductase